MAGGEAVGQAVGQAVGPGQGVTGTTPRSFSKGEIALTVIAVAFLIFSSIAITTGIVGVGTIAIPLAFGGLSALSMGLMLGQAKKLDDEQKPNNPEARIKITG